MERVVKASTEFACGPSQGSAQVGAANVADEQRITREDGGRVFPVSVEIENQDRDGLDRVAGSFEHLQPQPWEIECIAVLHCHEGVFRLAAGAQMNAGSATVA